MSDLLELHHLCADPRIQRLPEIPGIFVIPGMALDYNAALVTRSFRANHFFSDRMFLPLQQVQRMKALFYSLPLGARYMLLSGLGFSLMAVCVKQASQQGLPLMEIVAARALVSLVLSYVDVRRRGVPLLGQRKGLLIARAVVGTLALCCAYYAVTAMPLADATVLQYLHPMFTALIAWFFLKERIQGTTLLCIVLSLSGLLAIARPEFLFGAAHSELSWFALLAAIGGAFGSAVAYVLVRKLSQTEDASVIIFYFPLFALPFSLLWLGEDAVMPQGAQWLTLLLVGVFTQIGQIGITKAMQTETAGKATAFSYVQVLMAAVFGWWLFDEVPEVWTYIGAALILVGAVVNLYGSRRGATKVKL